MRQKSDDISLVEGDNGLNVELIPIVIPIAGEISHIWMWYEPLETWGIVWRKEGPAPDVGPEIPLNGEIYLAPVGVNRSEVSIMLHMDLEVTFPDGTKYTPSATPESNQDGIAEPGGGWAVIFEPFNASQEGTYTVVATLSSEGQVLDSVTFTLVSTPAIAEPFTFSDVTAYSVPWVFWSTFRTMNWFCTITNPNNAVVTKTLKLMMIYYTNGSASAIQQWWEFELTLNPNQVYAFNWYGNTRDQRKQGAYNGPEMVRGHHICMWLEDTEGNKSPEGCAYY